MLSGIL